MKNKTLNLHFLRESHKLKQMDGQVLYLALGNIGIRQFEAAFSA